MTPVPTNLFFFFRQPQQILKQKHTHNVNRMGEFVAEKTTAGWALACKCTSLNDLSVTGHTISTEANCASEQVEGVEHRKITPTSQHPLTNPAQGGSRNHHGNVNGCGSCYRCPPLHKDSRVKHHPPTTPCQNAGEKKFIRQHSPVRMSPPLNNTLPASGRLQGNLLTLVGDIHKLKTQCRHFSFTYCLKIHKASYSRPLEPGKNPGQQHSLPILPHAFL